MTLTAFIGRLLRCRPPGPSIVWKLDEKEECLSVYGYNSQNRRIWWLQLTDDEWGVLFENPHKVLSGKYTEVGLNTLLSSLADG